MLVFVITEPPTVNNNTDICIMSTKSFNFPQYKYGYKMLRCMLICLKPRTSEDVRKFKTVDNSIAVHNVSHIKNPFLLCSKKFTREI